MPYCIWCYQITHSQKVSLVLRTAGCGSEQKSLFRGKKLGLQVLDHKTPRFRTSGSLFFFEATDLFFKATINFSKQLFFFKATVFFKATISFSKQLFFSMQLILRKNNCFFAKTRDFSPKQGI
jgi:hypothetical protein